MRRIGMFCRIFSPSILKHYVSLALQGQNLRFLRVVTWRARYRIRQTDIDYNAVSKSNYNPVAMDIQENVDAEYTSYPTILW